MGAAKPKNLASEVIQICTCWAHFGPNHLRIWRQRCLKFPLFGLILDEIALFELILEEVSLFEPFLAVCFEYRARIHRFGAWLDRSRPELTIKFELFELILDEIALFELMLHEIALFEPSLAVRLGWRSPLESIDFAPAGRVGNFR